MFPGILRRTRGAVRFVRLAERVAVITAREFLMAQFIQVGTAFVNLDQVSVLDLDRTPQGIVLRVHTDSAQPVFEATVAPQAEAILSSLVASPTLRIQAADPDDR